MQMATIPPKVKAKIAPLLRLQSSDNAGERANASAAITRMLKANGFDWHDLTESLLTEAVPAPPEKPARRPPPSDDDLEMYLSSEDAVELVDALKDKIFDSRSLEFLSSLAERACRYRTVRLSPKQRRWLLDLTYRAGLAAEDWGID